MIACHLAMAARLDNYVSRPVSRCLPFVGFSRSNSKGEDPFSSCIPMVKSQDILFSWSGKQFHPSCAQLSSRHVMMTSVRADSVSTSLPTIGSAGRKHALISLSDKSGIYTLARGSIRFGLEGRVKTLHPIVHAGILARRDIQKDMKDLEAHGIGTFDVVVVNFYPFHNVVTAPGGAEFKRAIENIGGGGPSMVRSAAKNFKDVLVVVDPADYPELLLFLQGAGIEPDSSFRMKLAHKAFQHTTSYDSVITDWFRGQMQYHASSEWNPPANVFFQLSMKSDLRYGENPHQKAACYTNNSLMVFGSGGMATASQHHGKEMSFTNYMDADAAWSCVSEFTTPTCVIVKHTIPCGVASNSDILEAYRLAVHTVKAQRPFAYCFQNENID